MKILYITAYPLEYNTSANMRNRAIIRGLIKNGHVIDTLSASVDSEMMGYDSSVNVEYVNKRYWLKMSETYSKLVIKKEEKLNTDKKIKLKIKTVLYKLYTKISLYDTKKSLVKKVKGIEFEEKYDIIISSSDPKSAHLIAEEVIKVNSGITRKWIQYWGDPFAMDINKNSIVPRIIINKEEKRILSLANKVIYVSPFTYKEQCKLYKKLSNKMCFLPIAYEEKCNLVKAKKKNHLITLGYFGNYYTKDRDIKPLIKTAEEEDIKLILCGNTDIEIPKTNNITSYTRMPNEKVKELQEEVDILVCVCNRKGTQIPGKIYHYSATNKPILILIDGDNKLELKEYFNSFNRFIVCENTKEDILKTIRNLDISKLVYTDFEAFNPGVIARKFLEFENGKDKEEKSFKH